jgi:predicted RNA polymerase sigma factor
LKDIREPEAAAEAFATAVERWPADGVPPKPGAWLTTTANRNAIDRIRRENKRDGKQKEAQLRQIGATPNRSLWSAMNWQISGVAAMAWRLRSTTRTRR